MKKGEMENVIKEPIMAQTAPMYLYATEMVGSYYSLLGVKDKAVLTVIGSGDQMLNALFLGAKRVVGFDINEHAKLITELKVAAVKKMEYQEFLDYFGSDESEATLDYELYGKVNDGLGKDARDFFDGLYRSFDCDGPTLVASEHFRQRFEVTEGRLMVINSYLENEASYLKLRMMLASTKLEFVTSDIRSLAFDEQADIGAFDVINLSNVPNYMVENRRYAPFVTVKDFLEILSALRRKLTDGGRVFYYSYSLAIYPNKLTDTTDGPPASRDSTVKEVMSLEGFDVEQISFEGTNGDTEDTITVLQKADA